MKLKAVYESLKSSEPSDEKEAAAWEISTTSDTSDEEGISKSMLKYSFLY